MLEPSIYENKAHRIFLQGRKEKGPGPDHHFIGTKDDAASEAVWDVQRGA